VALRVLLAATEHLEPERHRDEPDRISGQMFGHMSLTSAPLTIASRIPSSA